MLGKKVTADNVVKDFTRFLTTYKKFRKSNKLSGEIINAHEILTAMSDKHGRICRQVKHKARKDEKSDWPEGLTKALTGYLVYATILLNRFGLDISNGMKKELEESVSQHADS